jgi:outer membrane protein TolC
MIFDLAVSQITFAENKEKISDKETNQIATDSDTTEVDLQNIELPPLQYFLDAALNSPTVNMNRALKKEQENRLKITKREWLNNIRGNGNYSYGSMGSMTESSATGQSTYFQYFGEVMSLYNIGASITIPLDLIFSQKNKIKAQEAVVEQANYKLLQAIEDRKLLIVETYSIAIQNLKSLRVTEESVAISNSSVKFAELEYINGRINLSELNTIKRAQTLALLTNQEAKTALTVAIQKLEILTNVKIIK